MSRTLTYLRDTQRYIGKPADCGSIKKRMSHPRLVVTGTVEQLVEDCLNYTIAPISIAGRPRKKGLDTTQWISQCMVFVDVDNEVDLQHKGQSLFTKGKAGKDLYQTPDSVLNLCRQVGLTPTIVYTTATSTEEHHRLRIVFVLDRTITDSVNAATVVVAVNNLLSVDGQLVADTKCAELSRVFFPGKKITHVDFSAINSVDDILNLAASLCVRPAYREATEEEMMLIGEKQIQKVNAKHTAPLTTAKSLVPSSQEVQLIRQGDYHRLRELLTCRLRKALESPQNADDTELLEWWEKTHTLDHSSITTYINKLLRNDCMDKLPPHENPVFTGSLSDYMTIIGAFPLSVFLGAGRSLNCLFHEDANPSAYISFGLQSNEDGVITKKWRYFCNSLYCSFDKGITTDTGRDVNCGDIIDVVAALRNCSWDESFRFVQGALGLTYQTHFQFLQRQNIKSWINAFQCTDKIKERWPKLYTWTWPHIRKLVSLLQFASDICPPERNFGEGFTFTASVRQLATLMREQLIRGTSDIATLNYRLLLFCMLGFLDRVKDCDVPAKMLQEAKDVSKYNTGQYVGQTEYHTCFYAIPKFSAERFDQAAEVVRILDNKGVRRSSIGYEALARAFGSDAAQECYVQCDKRVLSTEIDEMERRLIRTINGQIEKWGFTTRARVCSKLRGVPQQTAEMRFNQLWPVLMEKAQVKMIKADAETIKRLKVTNRPRSYPNIIVPVEIEETLGL